MPEPQDIWRRAWGGARDILRGSQRFSWVDLLVVVALGGVFYAIIDLASEWTAPHRATVQINLSPWALPGYTLISLARGLLAYVISLTFTLLYGYWAAKDARARRVLIPLLDILQSIPVLGFLPGLLLALNAAFPNNNVGLELAVVLMIFTGQAWNMTFSYYHSLRSVPQDQQDAATAYRFTWWQRLKWVELPFSTMGLVWNSMMSMAGGWFFLMICENFQLKDDDFRRPGLGSYMQAAMDANQVGAMLWALLAMLLMIVMLDQLLWRPVVVWSQKFRVEEGGEQPMMTSWFLNWLRRSQVISVCKKLFGGMFRREHRPPQVPVHIERPLKESTAPQIWGTAISLLALVSLLLLLAFGGWKLISLLRQVPLNQWGETFLAAMLTLTRVLVSTAVGTLWALPAGLAIGLSPKLSRIFQPIVQVAASFPAPMLFPLVIAGLQVARVSLNWGCILLMLLGTQWYILFNVIAGAMAVPADLREAARGYRFDRWQRFRTLYLPAVFPYLVTGWVTAAGGAWNASIVAEFVKFREQILEAGGLGDQISRVTTDRDFPMLAASVLVMAIVVVIFNRTVWRRLYELAERRYSLSK
ncbi:MAG TPA: ABC transporter permease subunit [Pirellulales bacterium]|nr:ABC transporter permease subunit [Pirellulales bacterium]